MLLQFYLNPKNAFMFLPVQLNVDHFYVTRESLDHLLQFVSEFRYRELQVIELKIIFPKNVVSTVRFTIIKRKYLKPKSDCNMLQSVEKKMKGYFCVINTAVLFTLLEATTTKHAT